MAAEGAGMTATPARIDRFRFVHDHELRDLIEGLEDAVETLSRGTHARKFERADAFAAIEAVVDYLCELRGRHQDQERQ
jgi:hypothetical protein